MVGLGPGYAPLVPAPQVAAGAHHPLLVEASRGRGVGLQGAARLPLDRGGPGAGAGQRVDKLFTALGVEGGLVTPAAGLV